MNKPQLPQDATYCVVGAGQQGSTHTKKLLDFGVTPEQITLVDIDGEKLRSATENFGNVRTATSLQSALQTPPTIGLIMTNTADHLDVILQMHGVGVQHQFAEKPLIAADQLTERQADVERIIHEVRPTTAYLMNFSPATLKIIELMDKEQLRVVQGFSYWGKNRINNNRPTLGDAEDELTHPLSLLQRLVAHNQTITRSHIKAVMPNLPFVNVQAQSAAHNRDATFPLEPNSSSGLIVNNMVEGQDTPISLVNFSSFVAPRQHRAIELNLADASGTLRRGIVVEFDTPDGDVLAIYDMQNSKTEPEVIIGKTDKIADNLGAFLQSVATGKIDPRLVNVQEAIHSIRMMQRAQEDNKNLGVAV